MFNRITLRRPVTMTGVGLHTGEDSTVRIFPSLKGKGIRLRLHGGFFQHISTVAVLATERCTRLRFEDGRILDTVEHLMAALAIFGLTDIDIEFTSAEAPILDGSSLPWIEAFASCGLRHLNAPSHSFFVTRRFEFAHRGASYMVTPGALHYDVSVDFSGTAIGRQRIQVGSSELAKLADSRTFALETEIAALQGAGLALGGGLHNAVVIGASGPLNPEGFRHPDECVRHKALDLVGDLHLRGAPIIGRFKADRPGHAANNAFLNAMLDEGVVSLSQPSVMAA